MEAKRFVPAFPDRIEPERLSFIDWRIDEEAKELTDDRLQIAVVYPDLGFSPFDHAVRMRGLEKLMLDVFDAPERVHELMDIITSAFEQHHRNREQKGWLNVVPSSDGRYTQVGFRVHCAHIPSDYDPTKPLLRHEWTYISAQTSSGLGPEMFAEFVHPYNVRLARYFSNQTVYYHGCEQLDHKLDVLSTLPNLRRFHVSPWSSMEAAREKFQGRVVLEAHAHPGRVFFSYSSLEMKEEVERLVRAAEGVPLDLNLSDIHSVNAAIGLFYLIFNWNIFMPAVFFLTSPRKYTIQVVLRDILTQHMLEDQLPFEQSAMMSQAGPQGIQAAITIVAMIPILMVYPFIQKYFTSGIMIGSIKG